MGKTYFQEEGLTVQVEGVTNHNDPPANRAAIAGSIRPCLPRKALYKSASPLILGLFLCSAVIPAHAAPQTIGPAAATSGASDTASPEGFGDPQAHDIGYLLARQLSPSNLPSDDDDAINLAQADQTPTDAVQSDATQADAAPLPDQETADAAQKKSAYTTVNNFVELVLTNSDRLAISAMNVDIAAGDVAVEQGIFDPTLTASAGRTDAFVKTSADEFLQRFRQSEFDSRADSVDMTIEKRLTPGTTIRAQASLEKDINSTQSQVGRDREYSSLLNFSVEQPLLRGAGATATQSRIRIAALEHTRSIEAHQLERTELARIAAARLCDAQRATHLRNIHQDGITAANAMLEQVTNSAKLGKASDYDVLSMQDVVATRQAKLAGAERDLSRARHAMKQLMPQHISFAFSIDADKWPALTPLTDSRTEAIENALQTRPELKMAVLELEQQTINNELVENETKADLRVQVAYGFNGLNNEADEAIDEAFDDQHRTWSAGVSFTTPLFSDANQARRDNAKLQQEQARLRRRMISRQVLIEVSQAREIAEKSLAEAQHYKDIYEFRSKRSALDAKMVEHGKMSPFDKAQRDDLLLEAAEDFINRLYAYKQARIDYYYMQGQLPK